MINQFFKIARKQKRAFPKDQISYKMLAANRLPEVLKTLLNDGVEGACLMTSDGSLLCSVQANPGKSLVTDTSLAAISSSIMNNFVQGTYFTLISKVLNIGMYSQCLFSFCGCTGNPDVSFHVLKLEKGCLAITTAGKGYLLAAYGKNVGLGLLRGRLLALSQYFARVFEQLK